MLGKSDLKQSNNWNYSLCIRRQVLSVMYLRNSSTSLQEKRKVKNMERKHTSVYLNCCSTFFTICEQSRHLKVASRSSGRTSLVRVTTPITDVNFPISAVVSSLNLTTQVIANLSQLQTRITTLVQENDRKYVTRGMRSLFNFIQQKKITFSISYLIKKIKKCYFFSNGKLQKATLTSLLGLSSEKIGRFSPDLRPSMNLLQALRRYGSNLIE